MNQTAVRLCCFWEKGEKAVFDNWKSERNLSWLRFAFVLVACEGYRLITLELSLVRRRS